MTTQPRPDVPIDRPGALIAAVPAVLGFVPEKSLVLVTLVDGEMGAVLRADLGDAVGGQFGQLAELTAASRAERAIAIVVAGAERACCRMCVEEYRELSRDLAAELEDRGVELYAAHVVDTIAVGGRWYCADGCGVAGAVEDPDCSPLAVAAVLDGRRLYARRADLVGVIAPVDPGRAAALMQEIDRLAEADGVRPDSQARIDIEHALACAEQIASGGALDDAALVRLAVSLTDTRVRDTLYALAVGDEAGSAESLWIDLARRLPDQWRVEPLVLLAFSAYVRGDGPLAGISLDAALACRPEHRMAEMLDRALQTAMRPEQIRDLARTGYRLARQLGVQLPPRRLLGRRAG